MPKIVAIADNLGKDLCDGLEALGDLYTAPRSGFDVCHADLRRERDADFVITCLPHRGMSERTGYSHAVQTVRETILDLRIPVIAYSGMTVRHSFQACALPAFLVLREFKDPEQDVLNIARAVARNWFPLSPTEREEFMTKTLEIFQREVTRTDYANTDAEYVLLKRFGVLDDAQLEERWKMSEPIREFFGVQVDPPEC